MEGKTRKEQKEKDIREIAEYMVAHGITKHLGESNIQAYRRWRIEHGYPVTNPIYNEKEEN